MCRSKGESVEESERGVGAPEARVSVASDAIQVVFGKLGVVEFVFFILLLLLLLLLHHHHLVALVPLGLVDGQPKDVCRDFLDLCLCRLGALLVREPDRRRKTPSSNTLR